MLPIVQRLSRMGCLWAVEVFGPADGRLASKEVDDRAQRRRSIGGSTEPIGALGRDRLCCRVNAAPNSSGWIRLCPSRFWSSPPVDRTANGPMNHRGAGVGYESGSPPCCGAVLPVTLDELRSTSPTRA